MFLLEFCSKLEFTRADFCNAVELICAQAIELIGHNAPSIQIKESDYIIQKGKVIYVFSNNVDHKY